MQRNMVAALTVLAGAMMFGGSQAAAQKSRWGADYFPNVTLTTQDGASVRFYDDLIKGKIVAINLIYTTCKYACPLETARLAQVQKVLGDRMGRDVFFYSITIDPAHDTPAVLKEYAEKFHAGPGWLFLTGRQEDIDLISRKVGLSAPLNLSDPDGHAPFLLVGNEVTGQWMRNSSLDNPKFLARTIGDWLNSWQGPRRALQSYANAPTLSMDRGEYTFKQHCAACHTVGGGAHIGPDLLGVTRTRDHGWLTRFILAPDKLLADGDPIATELFTRYKQVTMPNLALNPSDVSAVVEYLVKQDAASAPAPAAANAGASAKALLDPYLRIQEALSADTIDGTNAAAQELAREAEHIGATALTIRDAAIALQHADDLKNARAAFGRVSDAVLAYTSAANISPGDDVVIAYCPMARKYWLQKGTAIRNPYYGRSMIDCGRLSAAPSGPR